MKDKDAGDLIFWMFLLICCFVSSTVYLGNELADAGEALEKCKYTLEHVKELEELLHE